jgi:glycosyltransferase involved in cell wall biosynthesis
VRRAGRVLTGVDRVEFAYLDHLSQTGPVYGLIRSTLGYILLDHTGCCILRDRLSDNNWGNADRLSRLKRGLDPLRARAESDLRRIALDRCLPIRLSHMLRKHFPAGVNYLNVGHSNLTNRVVSALQLCNARIGVMVHDTIPLDFPQYQRPGAVQSFRSFLDRVGQFADLIICNSEQTQRDIQRHMLHPPRMTVSHLGVEISEVGLPSDGMWEVPYFVTLGTIEPRKNHGFLLDLWQDVLDADLLIIGARGWNNQAVFDRLDRRPPRVHELGTLPDDQTFALLSQAHGLLCPSFAEGFGLPPVEAAALGTPLVCNDLAVYREFLGDIPVYENIENRYNWFKHIEDLVNTPEKLQQSKQMTGFTPPNWDSHFKDVLTLI